MVAFAFIHCNPAPSNIQKPSPKPSKTSATNSSSVPVEALPASEGAASKDNWCQEVTGDSVATIQRAHICRDDVVGTQGMCSDCPTMVNILI